MTERLGWGRGLALLGAISLAVYLYLALFVPGTMAYAPFSIQDDARQFHVWLPQLVDHGLLAGDPLAAYWRAMSPLAYRLPFALAADVGVDPVFFGRLLPVPLVALSLWAAWRLALKIAPDPRVAFFAAALCFGYLIHDDALFSATPRSFSHPLLLLALDAIVGRRPWWAAGWLTLLASLYPTTAVAGFGIFALAQAHRVIERRPLRLAANDWLPLAVGALTVVLAMLPLQQRAKAWGPVVTLAQALAMPNMNRITGRSSIVDASGHIGWVCSARVGYLPEALPCDWGWTLALPVNALLLVPLVVLAVRAALGRPDPAAAERNRVYLHALVACTGCFVLAALTAFALHFPGRYTQRILGPLEWLAIGQLIGLWLVGKPRAWSAGAVAVMLVVAATPMPGFVHPDPGLVRFVRTLPRTARLAGVAEELAVIPALTGRAITAAPEQAIPWHMGYYAPFDRQLRLSLAAVSAPDQRGLAAAMLDSRADYLVVDRRLLAHSAIPERYGRIDPDAVAEAQAELARGPSLVQRDAARCALYRGPGVWVLDGKCLALALPPPDPGLPSPARAGAGAEAGLRG